jgi:hypothetical protein
MMVFQYYNFNTKKKRKEKKNDFFQNKNKIIQIFKSYLRLTISTHSKPNPKPNINETN